MTLGYVKLPSSCENALPGYWSTRDARESYSVIVGCCFTPFCYNSSIRFILNCKKNSYHLLMPLSEVMRTRIRFFRTPEKIRIAITCICINLDISKLSVSRMCVLCCSLVQLLVKHDTANINSPLGFLGRISVPRCREFSESLHETRGSARETIGRTSLEVVSANKHKFQRGN